MKRSYQIARAFAVGVALVASTNAWAGWVVGQYDAAKFAAAQASGKPVLLEFYAPWCMVCLRQERALKALREARPEITIFQVDFDGDRKTVRHFNVSSQGTIIAFSGKAEKGRLVGQWKEGEINAFAGRMFPRQ
jgi:thioredoxin 1